MIKGLKSLPARPMFRIVAVVSALFVFGVASADPPERVSRFYGEVAAQGAPVPAGLEVVATAGGLELAREVVEFFGDIAVYRLDVPGDDPGTLEVEGAVEGETVEFRLSGSPLTPTATWHNGDYQQMDLSAAIGADLVVALDDGREAVAAGDTVSYQVTVSNPSDLAATDAMLSVTLPAEAVFVAADEGGSGVGQQVSWPGFDLAAGGVVTRTLELRVASQVAGQVGTFEVTATVSSGVGDGLDPNPSDNSSNDIDALEAFPDLVVTLDDGLTEVAPGQDLDSSLSVSNVGSRDALGVQLSLTIPEEVIFLTASGDGGERDPGRVTWPPFELAAGESTAFAIRLRLPSSPSPTLAVVESQATATPGNGPDGAPADNSASDSTTVLRQGDLTVVAIDPTGSTTDAQNLALSGSVAVEIANAGNADLAFPFELKVFEDRDGDALPGGTFDVELGTVTVDSGPLAGSSAVVQVPVAGTVRFLDNLLYAFVDSTDVISELDETDNIDHSGSACVQAPVVEDFDPVVELSWPGDDDALEAPLARESLSTPIVVQLDDDNGDGRVDTEDVPDIVFVAANLENPLNPLIKMRAISGRTADSLWTVDPPVSEGLAFAPSGLAAGDLTGDGDIEIVVSTPEPPVPPAVGFSNRISAYDHRGQRLWTSVPYVTHPTGVTFTNRDFPSLADLDGDGDSEIIVGAHVFDHQGALLWSGTGGQGYQSARNEDLVDSGAISVVADLDLDGSPEVVTGNTAYRADGAVYWQQALDDGYPGIGNFDADDEPEIVVVARGFLRLHEHDGTVIWGPVALPGVDPEAGGAPTIADFDADGEPEIGVAGSNFYTVFEGDGTPLWQHAVQDESSNQTGSTVFDLDGNGSFEVIYRDETHLRILNGEDGQVLFEDFLTSFTANEMPVVADVDGDGQAEIVVTSDKASELSLGEDRTFGLRVYGDRNGNWLGTRGLWNQHAYSLDNVTEDGKIPAQPAYGWLTHNTYRANAQPPGGVFQLADVSLSAIGVDFERFPSLELSARVGNGGASDLAAGLPVAFYRGDPSSGDMLGTGMTSLELAPGEYEDVSILTTVDTSSVFTLHVVAGDDGENLFLPRDCQADNDRHQMTVDLADVGLWVGLQDGADSIAPGGEGAYTVTVGNASPFPRAGINVRNVLPSATHLVSASDGGTLENGAVTWPAFSLGAGASTTLALTYRVDALVTPGARLSNLVSAFDDGTVPDIAPFNNVAVDVNTVRTLFAEAGGPYAGEEGSAILFDGSASTSLAGAIVGWAWDFDSDGVFDDGAGAQASFAFPENGSFAVALQVTDEVGGVESDSVVVTVTNAPPSLAVTDQSAVEGSELVLDLPFDDPGSLDTHTATLDWGDGTLEPGVVVGLQVRGSHIYPQDGVSVAEVCITDDDGDTACSSFAVTVDNAAPIVTAGSRPVFLGEWVAEDRSSANPGDWQVSEDGLSVEQDENSSQSVFLSPFPAIGLTYDGTIEVGPTGDDDFIGFVLGFKPGDFQNIDAEYLLIDWKQQVQNTALRGLALSRVFGTPSSGEWSAHNDDEANGPDHGLEELQRAFTLGDAGWADRTPHVFTLETSPNRLRVWVDGTLEFDLAGDFAFGTGRIGFFNSSQENVSYSSFTVQRINVLEGEEAILDVDFVDPGVLDTHTATVDWQDGILSEATVEEVDGQGTAQGVHIYADDLVAVAEACVTDDGDATGCRAVPVTVLNAEPVVTTFRQPGFLGESTAFEADFTDSGVLDTHTATFHWGDGVVSPATVSESGGADTVSASHTFSEEIPEARVCVVDKDGAEACDAFAIDWLAQEHDSRIEVMPSRASVGPGESLTYRVRATNLGSLQPTGITVSLALPAELAFASADRGGSLSGSTVTWALPKLRYLATETFQVEVVAGSSLPAGGVGIATATLADGGTVGPDTDPSNNVAVSRVLYRQTDDPEIEIGINLARDPDRVLTSSGSSPLAPVTSAVDGNPASLWIPDDGCTGETFLELLLPQDATIFGVGFDGGDGVNARAFTEGRFLLYDESDELLHDTGVIVASVGSRAVVDLENLVGIRKVRLRAASIAGCGTLAEVQVFGGYGASGLLWPEGRIAGFGIFFDAPSAAASWTVAMDLGDGATAAVPAEPGSSGRFLALIDHLYPDNRIFAIEACVSDAGGERGCLPADLEVFNVIPRVSKGEAVDLRLWQVQHFAGSQQDSFWAVSEDGTFVEQQVNSRASIFYGDFPALHTQLKGRIRVMDRFDNDFVGFALGIQPGDEENPDAEFLLISWRHSFQPSFSFEGLALSRVYGIPSAFELFNLRDSPANGPTNGVEQLVRGINYGDLGWRFDEEHEFSFELTPNRLRVFVDGELEMDYQGLDEVMSRPLDDGRFGFYNYSEHAVFYRAIERQAFVVDEGYELPLRSSFTDPGADTWVVDLDWGDGTAGTGTIVGGLANTIFTGTHTYADNLPGEATYPVIACATDDDGGHDCSTLEVLVRNLPPVVTIGSGDGEVLPGGTPFVLTGAGFSDRGVSDTHTAEVSWGEGTVVAATILPAGEGLWTVAAEHVPEGLGFFEIELCVTDDDGARACDRLTLEVVNGSPPTDILPAASGFEGAAAEMSGTFVDVDFGDSHTATIDWGDGSALEPVTVVAGSQGGTFSGSHTYVESGNYPLTVCVTDAEARQACGTGTAAIGNLPPILLGTVDFRQWTSEPFNPDGAGLPAWRVSDNGTAVSQAINNQPSVFLGNFQLRNQSVNGIIRGDDDNDYMGFAVGFESGDFANVEADYLLVTWKGGPEDSGPPVGLRLWRIRGIPSTLFSLNNAPQAELLAVAQNLGELNWEAGSSYRFRLDSSPESFRLWIDGRLEIDVVAPGSDPFSEGRLGWYLHSQKGATALDWRVAPSIAAAQGLPSLPLQVASSFQGWLAETPAHTSARPAPQWQVSSDGLSVSQHVNSHATVFLSDADLFSDQWASVTVNFLTDDDVGGLVVGFDPGDGAAEAPDYLLVRWNNASGLSLRRVRGALYTETELLAEGLSYGDAPHQPNHDYVMTVRLTTDRFRLWVDGDLELDVAAPTGDPFDLGRLGFFCDAQQGIRFRQVETRGLTLDEGQSLPRLGVAYTDPGVLDTHHATVDWADGSQPETAAAVSGASLLAEHTFVDDIDTDSTVCVFDDEADSACLPVAVRVRNLPPQVTAVDQAADAGASFALTSVTFTDAGASDTHTATVDWGDGSVDGAQATGSGGSGSVDAGHVYEVAGTYDATVCVADDDGGEACDGFQVEVAEVGIPELVLSKVDTLSVDLDGDGTADRGDRVLYQLSLSNSGTGPATGLQLTDAIPAHAVLVAGSVVSDSGTVIAEDPVTVDLPILAAAASVSVSFEIEIADPLPLAVTQLSNQAWVTSVELAAVASDDPDEPGDADPTRTSTIGDESLRCVSEPFDQPLSDLWQSAFLGDADQGTAEVVGGVLHLSGDGSSLYQDDDNGHFLYREATGDFRVELTVTDIPVDEGGQYRKACLMVRAGLDPLAERFMACFVPHFGSGEIPVLQFDLRSVAGGQATELASTEQDVQLPARLALTRRGDAFTVSYSTDEGSTWSDPLGGAGGTVELALPEVLDTGVMVASYDTQQTFTAAVDDLRLCYPNGAEPELPADPPVCDPQQPLDVVYLLDLSESMGADFADGSGNKLEAAREALLRVHDQITVRQDGSRAALLTFAGSRDVAANLAGSLSVLATLTTDLSALGSLIANLDASDIEPLSTTPTSLGLQGLREQLAPLFDTEGQPALILVTDGVPNIDSAGRGPQEYSLSEIQGLSLRDEQGDFLSWSQAAWLGGFNGTLDTYDGEPLANAMRELNSLSSEVPELLVYGIAVHGNGVALGSFNDDLVDYAAWVSGGRSYSADDATGIEDATTALLGDLLCDAAGTGALGDRLWNDLDGDGVQDVGEPGLPLVSVELLDAAQAIVAVTVTDLNGSYLFADLEPGPYTVRVDRSTLPGGLSEPAHDLDGLLTPDQATASVQAWQVRRDLDFGYRATPVAELESPDAATVCVVDDFADGLVSAPWELSAVGDADFGGAQELGERLELSSNGSAMWHDDHMHFLHQPMSGDFRVEVEVVDVPVDPGGSRFRKAGLMVRSGLGVRSPRILVQYLPDPDDSQGPMVQFGVRTTAGGDSVSLSNVLPNVGLPIHLALDKRGTTWTAWTSTDGGESWQQPVHGGLGGMIELDLGATPLVGLAAASYDAASVLTLAFDDFTLCSPAAVATPQPPSPAACDAQQALDLILLLDLSGSMATDDAQGTSRLEAAQLAIADLIDRIETRGDGSRVGLVTYAGRETPEANLGGAAQVVSGLTTSLDSVRLLTNGLSVQDLDPTSGTPSPLALAQLTPMLEGLTGQGRAPAVVWLSDELPNIDRVGSGPYVPEAQPPNGVTLRDGAGDFLPWPQVAWTGPYLGELGAFTGEPTANAMAEVDALRQLLPELRIYGLALQGDGVVSPVFDEDLLAYAAWSTSASSYSATTATELLLANEQLWSELVCEP